MANAPDPASPALSESEAQATAADPMIEAVAEALLEAERREAVETPARRPGSAASRP